MTDRLVLLSNTRASPPKTRYPFSHSFPFIFLSTDLFNRSLSFSLFLFPSKPFSFSLSFHFMKNVIASYHHLSLSLSALSSCNSRSYCSTNFCRCYHSLSRVSSRLVFSVSPPPPPIRAFTRSAYARRRLLRDATCVCYCVGGKERKRKKVWSAADVAKGRDSIQTSLSLRAPTRSWPTLSD